MVRWRAHAVAACATGVAKVFVVCLVLGFHPGALGFAFLCGVIALVLNRAISSLPDAGDADIAGEGEVPEPEHVAAEDSSSSAVCGREDDEQYLSTSAAFGCEEEEDSSFAAVCDREEEDKTTKENFDGSDEVIEEQEEQNFSDGCMDEWNLVEADPVMPINVNGGANGSGKFKRWPQKYSYLRWVL
uniref:Uncharacterized protein n=1 Tax=Leersia perrieri TaxID=77586 RepID=A0A0D9W764_9ORYZ